MVFFRASAGLDGFDLFAQGLLRLAGALLQPSEEFFLLALREKEIVVGEAGVFLLQLAGDFVPSAFEGEFGHGVMLLSVKGREAEGFPPMPLEPP